MSLTNRIVDYICYAHGLCAYFTNSMLLYLILNYSRPELGTYKYLMLSFTCCNIIFPTVHMLAMPHLMLNKRAFVFFPEGVLMKWPVVLAVVMLHFVYRYLAVIRPTLLRYFTREGVAYLVLFVACNGLVWGSSFHCSSYHINNHRDYFRDHVEKDYEMSVDNLPMLGLMFIVSAS
ncbi:unnamed protein product, partial [Mesorhabditis spiculigera]